VDLCVSNCRKEIFEIVQPVMAEFHYMGDRTRPAEELRPPPTRWFEYDRSARIAVSFSKVKGCLRRSVEEEDVCQWHRAESSLDVGSRGRDMAGPAASAVRAREPKSMSRWRDLMDDDWGLSRPRPDCRGIDAGSPQVVLNLAPGFVVSNGSQHPNIPPEICQVCGHISRGATRGVTDLSIEQDHVKRDEAHREGSRPLLGHW
jgi:hypothetical protein